MSLTFLIFSVIDNVPFIRLLVDNDGAKLLYDEPTTTSASIH
jgi:hypothetical protein